MFELRKGDGKEDARISFMDIQGVGPAGLDDEVVLFCPPE